MKRFLLKLISCLTPISRKREHFLNKHQILTAKISGDIENNHVDIPHNRNIKIKSK